MTRAAAAHDDTVAAYQGVEELERFTPQELGAYRAGLLERTVDQAAFVRERVPAGASMLEIGCGNGRLLIALARDGTLAGGTGLDVAASRIDFARAWAAEEGLGLRFDVADALNDPLPNGPFDAVACITGALGYFEPMLPGAAGALLRSAAAALRPGGLLLLELYPHPAWQRMLAVAGHELRLWSELPREDPWRFYLSHLTLDDAGNLRHDKTFVHRGTGQIDESRREHLRLYGERELRELVEAAGFSALEVHGDWHGTPYAEGEHELLVAAARR